MSERNPKVVDHLIPEIHVTEESPDGTVHEIEIAGVRFRRYPSESEGAGSEVERHRSHWYLAGMMREAEYSEEEIQTVREALDRAAFRQGVDYGEGDEGWPPTTPEEWRCYWRGFRANRAAPEGAVPDVDVAECPECGFVGEVRIVRGDYALPEGAVPVRVWRERANITRLSATHDVLQTIPEGTYNDGVNGWLVIPRTEEGE